MEWVNSGVESLRGRLVLGCSVGDDKLSFDTDGGRLSFAVHGDCCSESWFSELQGIENLIGQTVIGIEEQNVDDYDVNDGRCRQESDSVYGFHLVTDKGKATVTYRCSSNGYYGGWIEKYGGELKDMVDVVRDWRNEGGN